MPTLLTDLKPYFRRKDGDGHTYYVPADQVKDFDAWLKLDTESDEFYAHPGFDHFSLGKSDYDLKLWIDPHNLK